MKRTVIKIDENLCNGCGSCVGGCHEGALQLIDGKAVMISDLYCDGLGACIGDCPVGAITLEEREAEPYDETAVMERLVPKGEAAVLAHLKHLKDHNENEWVAQGIDYLKKHGINFNPDKIGGDTCKTGQTALNPVNTDNAPQFHGCPGSITREIKRPENINSEQTATNTDNALHFQGCPGSITREIKRPENINSEQENIKTITNEDNAPQFHGCPGSITREIKRPESINSEQENIQTTTNAANANKTPQFEGCPGSVMHEIKQTEMFTGIPPVGSYSAAPQQSELRQFPVQLHLINTRAGFLKGADLLLAADCTAFVSGEFHSRFLRGKSLAIGCPKLDSNLQTYIDKLSEMIDIAEINTMTVLIMEVPCCGKMMRIAQLAREQAKRNIPIKIIVLSVSGAVIEDRWI